MKEEIGYDKKGKKEFYFVYKKELIVYKKLLGLRISREEKKYIKDYEEKRLETEGKELIFYKNYIEWKNAIKEKYDGFEQENLENFIFYLENGKYLDSVIRDSFIGIATPIIVGIVLLYIEDYIRISTSELFDTIFIVVIFGVCFFMGLSLFNQYSNGKKLYEEYGKIIQEIYDDKYGKDKS